MVVEGEVTARDDIDASILDGLPVCGAYFLCNFLNLVCRDLVGPVRLYGLLDLALCALESACRRTRLVDTNVIISTCSFTTCSGSRGRLIG